MRSQVTIVARFGALHKRESSCTAAGTQITGNEYILPNPLLSSLQIARRFAFPMERVMNRVYWKGTALIMCTISLYTTKNMETEGGGASGLSAYSIHVGGSVN